MLVQDQDKGAQQIAFYRDAMYLVERGIWLPQSQFFIGNVSLWKIILYSWWRKWKIAKIRLFEEMKAPQLPQEIVRNTARVSITVVRALEQKILDGGVATSELVAVCAAVAELNRSAESLARAVETVQKSKTPRETQGEGTKIPPRDHHETVETVRPTFG